MFEKEIRKINELTEKLKTQGDITENEADWIYITSFLPWEEIIFFKSSAAKKYKDMDFFAPEKSSKKLYGAFSEWYNVVLQKVKQGGSGNFLSTVFNPDLKDRSSSYCQDIAEKIRLEFGDFFKSTYFANDIFLSKKERLLTGDIPVLPGDHFVTPTRPGVIERAMGKTKKTKLPNVDSHTRRIREIVLTQLGIPFLRDIKREDGTIYIYPERYSALFEKISNIFENFVPEPYTFLGRDHEIMIEKAKAERIIQDNCLKIKNKEENIEETKDVRFIKEAIKTLSSGRDISEEDADKIFLLFRYTQGFAFAGEILFFLEKEVIKPLSKELNKWYRTVRKMFDKGMTGNFVSTVPYYKMSQASGSIKKCIDTLPKMPTEVYILGEKSFDEYGSADFYTEIKGKKTRISSYRYGLIRKILDIEEYKPVETTDTKQVAFGYCDSFLQGKLEAVKNKGVTPIVAKFIDDTLSLMIHKRDMDKVKHILNVKKEELPELNSPDEYVEAIINSALQKEMEETAEDDFWIEIYR